jgi:response regulator RpfG family c-di-GMP phosphodiesterase
MMNVLIIDDEEEILEIIDFLVHDLLPNTIATFLAKDVAEAIKILSSTAIDLCICDHNLPDGKGSKVLNYIIEQNLKLKFILCSTVSPSEVADTYNINHIFFNIVKPDVFGGIEQLRTRLNSDSEENKSLEHSYIPISVDILYLLGKTPADIYIKMTENKYLKCLEGNTEFTLEEKTKYQKKTTNPLYCIKANKLPNSQSIITEAVKKIMQKNDLPLSERMEIVHAQLTDLIKFTGMSPELSEAVKENVTQTVNFIMKTALLHDFWNKLNLKGEYPSKLYTLHSMLAAVISKKLQWNTETTLFKLTMAAFFQDITLESVALMKLYDHDDFLAHQANFDRHEIKSYLEHPQKTIELIASIKNIPPDIDKIILEHHETPDGMGFPRKIGAKNLGPLSCTFILSGIFARYILEEGTNFELQNFVQFIENRGYSKGNFKATFDIIKSM